MNSRLLEFRDLVQFLYNGSPRLPQVTVATLKKRVIYWLAGNKRQPPVDIQRAVADPTLLIGFSPITVLSPDIPASLQDRQLHFVPIDIDGKDNTHIPGDELFHKVIEAAPNVSWRRSTSGKGLHGIYRFEKPVNVAKRVPSSSISSFLSHEAIIPLKALADAGVNIDKADLRALFMLGGEQSWVHVTQYLHPVSQEALALLQEAKCSVCQQAVPIEIRDDKINAIIGVLVTNGLIQAPTRVPFDARVNCGLVISALVSAGLAKRSDFATTTGQSGDTGTNGFITISPNYIKLYTFKEASVVWREDASLDYLDFAL